MHIARITVRARVGSVSGSLIKPGFTTLGHPHVSTESVDGHARNATI
jgi:hypothetical protein